MKTPYIEINESLGKINRIEMPSQDVYWVSLSQSNESIDECYLLSKTYSGNVISKRAISFGAERGELLIFDYDHGRHIIEYELLVERLRCADEEERKFLRYKMLELSTFGRELFPAYFGAFLPPTDTPIGPTTRYLSVCNGIFFVEGASEWFLAICYPIWQSELTIPVHGIGEPANKEQDIHRSFGYLFFDQINCAPALHELWKDTRYQALKSYVVSEELLVAALWKDHPYYVQVWNSEADKWAEVCLKNLHPDQTPESIHNSAEAKKIPQPTVTPAPFLKVSV